MKKNIYFDNAATTPLDPEVLEAMMPYFTDIYGNGSSIHTLGRQAKAAVENARKKVAELLHTSPSEIFFTSGGTEANNTVIRGCVESLDVKTVVSSPIEHHAILHPLEYLQKQNGLDFRLVNLKENAEVDLESLEQKLENSSKALVTLMHGNNEIGNLLDLNAVSEICRKYGAIFHSDTVQTVGKFPINLQELDIDFISGSAHKFHGPKGVGFLYINSNNRINPFIHGGAQERNMRGGTENVAGLVGLAKALEVAIAKQEKRQAYLKDLKLYLKAELEKVIPGVSFNGASGDLENSLYHLLNVSFPEHPDNQMLLFSLDIEGICVSGGSACSSGTDIGSHVLNALQVPEERANVRFSFAEQNTKEEIDTVVGILKRILNP
ncbi:cysteine desulfurase family protein [Jiulongibacter sediminis]|uniref:cysteine desulfurase n=1 Tax=Jiulongibacter sediminis TaxID=1605367 RepID=A0A0P7BNU2_9BACT|nr:cysteine desulfurase family protein [Jiulongibacter sediminis]KPM48882.1 cysteine desulfurase [Jiulongibacter sediminis]TBX25413.1 cysteine desulfurase [Jiulongibacter sediminis]